jgi:hypothetical protein
MKVTERGFEAISALVAFNGAGIGITVGLMQTGSPSGVRGLKIGASIFLFGFLVAVSLWLAICIIEARGKATHAGEDTLADTMLRLLLLAAALFVLGVGWTYLNAMSTH